MKTKELSDPNCILQSEAIHRITKWRDDQANLINALKDNSGHILEGMPMLHVHAFTFKYSEIVDLVNKIQAYNENHTDQEVTGMRFYLGVKTHDNQPISPSPCLITVGVTDFHPNESQGGDDVLVLTNPGDDCGIYDFSYPCPDTCANEGHSIMDVANTSN